MKQSQDRMNQITSLVAILISVIAMVLSIVEVSAMREQQRADVWPYLEITQHYTSEGFALRVTNKGVGPALVGSASMFDGDRRISDLTAFIAETVGEDQAFGYEAYGSRSVQNAVMAAGESVDLFSVGWTDASRLLLERWTAENNIDYRVCYCSIHEDCWRAALSMERAESAQQCR
ncbi:MAG: hypothetical protein AAFN07_04580 [Pseudomonadota bacterium]